VTLPNGFFQVVGSYSHGSHVTIAHGCQRGFFWWCPWCVNSFLKRKKNLPIYLMHIYMETLHDSELIFIFFRDDSELIIVY